MRLVFAIFLVASLLLSNVTQSRGDSAFPPRVAERFGEMLVSDQTGSSTEAFRVTDALATPDMTARNDAIPVDADSAAMMPGCDCGHCASGCANEWPLWDIQVGTVVYWRDNDTRNQLLHSPDRLEFGGGVGPKMLLNFRTDANRGLEASWFTFGDTAESRLGEGSRYYLTEYQSALSSGEINLVHTAGRFSLLGGFRMMRWSETYEDITTSSGLELRSRTDNDLWGGQIGARWRQDRRILFWETTGKVGVFANRANRTTARISNPYEYYYPPTSSYPRSYDTPTSVVLDFNYSVGLRLSPIWSLRCGYNLLWIDSLALAPNQYDNSQLTPITTKGSVLLNGLESSLEARW